MKTEPALFNLPPSGSYLYEMDKSLGGFYWTSGISGFTFGFNQKYIKIRPEEAQDFFRFIVVLSEHFKALKAENEG